VKTRSRKRYEAKYRGQWELRTTNARGGQVIYLGGTKRFNRETDRIFGFMHEFNLVVPAFKSLIHNGGRP
jgi:hypothetical protein